METSIEGLGFRSLTLTQLLVDWQCKKLHFSSPGMSSDFAITQCRPVLNLALVIGFQKGAVVDIQAVASLLCRKLCFSCTQGN